MYFYLDKEMAKQNIARCLYKSDKLLNNEELKIVREHFNFSSKFLIYEGEDIPYPIKYNFDLDAIEEVVSEEPVETFSEDVEPVQEEIFGKEDGQLHWYLNKEKAINKGLSETFMTSDKPLLDMYKYFGTENVLYYVGNELPYFCTYLPEENTVREASREEKYLRGQEELKDYEIFRDNKIETIEIPENTVNPYWNKETEQVEDIATEEEIKDYYFNKINSYKSQILNNGYDYNGHQQRCREKDLALLGNAVSALADMQTFTNTYSEGEKTINWAFNDNDISIMAETDLRMMRIAGAEFINNVYAIEAELKKATINKNIKIEEFIKKINEISTFKCYE